MSGKHVWINKTHCTQYRSLGEFMICKTEYATRLQRVSRRKRLCSVRPDYGSEREPPERIPLRKLSPLAFKHHDLPPYSPLYERKPAAYMMGDRLLCHPAIYDRIVAQFGNGENA